MTITAASANDGRNLLLRRTLSVNDRAIVASLQEDGRRVFVSIARDIGVTEKTIRNRVRYSLDNQVIQIVAITSPTALGYHSGALLGIVTDPAFAVSGIARQIADIPEVDYVAVTAGRYALLVEILAHDMSSLMRILETRVSKIEGLSSVETFPYFSIHYQQPRFSTFADRPITSAGVRAIEMNMADKGIMSMLTTDGRMPVNEVAERLGMSETQVRTRIRALIESGRMKVMAIINPMSLRFEAISWVALTVAAGHSIKQLADALTELGHLSYVVICSGRFDIFVELVCASNDELFDVLDSKVRTLPGVDEVETFLYLDLHYKRLGPVTVEAGS
tara:strand:- start:1110 stop:2111 length:1002 start_codon:yes stop_codon:yes gene_type:complete